MKPGAELPGPQHPQVPQLPEASLRPGSACLSKSSTCHRQREGWLPSFISRNSAEPVKPVSQPRRKRLKTKRIRIYRAPALCRVSLRSVSPISLLDRWTKPAAAVVRAEPLPRSLEPLAQSVVKARRCVCVGGGVSVFRKG